LIECLFIEDNKNSTNKNIYPQQIQRQLKKHIQHQLKKQIQHQMKAYAAAVKNTL
jgi:hypothetical protein